MQKIVGVRFKQNGKIYYFSPKDLVLKLDDNVIVETERGVEFGTIAIANSEINESELMEPLKFVIRIANEKDLKTKKDIESKEKTTFEQAKNIIKKYKLEMDLIDVEYTFDQSKIIFTYTAEDRVDFRELIKELANVYKARIELRQVGIRDEAKLIGGLGPCGREVCCKKYLQDFEKVSIKMAKTQGLSLNPTNISGLCGKLMCCLAYENNHYSETSRMMPKLNSRVKTPDGEGTVVYNNLLKKIVTVKVYQPDESYKMQDYELSKITFNDKGN